MDFIWQTVVSAIRVNDSELAARLRGKIYRISCMVDTEVVITNSGNFSAGTGCALYHACYILNGNGRLVLGDNSHLGAFCYVNVCEGSVTIGDDVAIGPGTKIIAYSNHYAKARKVTKEKIVSDIVIGNNVFIGANCTILPGVKINDNVIVAAGSVVKGELQPDSIYGGVPSRIIKSGWYG